VHFVFGKNIAKYFEIVGPNNYWVAPQNMNVIISTRCTAAGNIAATLQWAAPIVPGVAPTWGAIPSTNMVLSSLHSSTAASNRIQSQYCSIPKGYMIRISVDADTITYCCSITPCAFNIEA